MMHYVLSCFLVLAISMMFDLIICGGKATLWSHANLFLWVFLTSLWVFLSGLDIYILAKG